MKKLFKKVVGKAVSAIDRRPSEVIRAFGPPVKFVGRKAFGTVRGAVKGFIQS